MKTGSRDKMLNKEIYNTNASEGIIETLVIR